jgi:large subunit ribosomal protein L4
VLDENLVVLESLAFDAPKTKDFKGVLNALSVNSKALIVTADLDENVALSARNLPGVTVLTANGINVLDVLNHDKLIMTKAAVEKVEEVLA